MSSGSSPFSSSGQAPALLRYLNGHYISGAEISVGSLVILVIQIKYVSSVWYSTDRCGFCCCFLKICNTNMMNEACII